MDELDQEIDLDQITDVNLLQSLLDQTDDPEDRKVIRDRIKELTAAKKAVSDEKLTKINNQQHDRLQEKKKQAEEHKQRTADMYQKMSTSAPAGAAKQLDTNVLRKETTTPSPRATPITPSKPLSSGNLPLTIAPKDAVEDSIKRRQREAEERKRRILAAYDVASKTGGAGPKDVDLDVANKIDLEAYERQKGQAGGATFEMAGGVPVMSKVSSVPSTPTREEKPAFQPELDAMERALRERQQYCEEQKRKALESYRKVAAGPAGPKVWATNV